MSLPAFFELTRVAGGPIYVNPNHVTSIDFIGDDKDGYVAFIAMDTLTKEQSHFVWGELRSLDAMLDKHTFGSHVRLTTVVSPRPVSPSTLFSNKVEVGFSQEDSEQPYGYFRTAGGIGFND